jgi:glutamate N-acetyltransferase / amino-acid N-acetyltransferase
VPYLLTARSCGAGAQFDQEDLGVSIGPHVLMEAGQPRDFDQAQVSQYLKDRTAVHNTVEIGVTLGAGEYGGKAWGCDLSYDYVKINAEYTT